MLTFVITGKNISEYSYRVWASLNGQQEKRHLPGEVPLMLGGDVLSLSAEILDVSSCKKTLLVTVHEHSTQRMDYLKVRPEVWININSSETVYDMTSTMYFNPSTAPPPCQQQLSSNQATSSDHQPTSSNKSANPQLLGLIFVIIIAAALSLATVVMIIIVVCVCKSKPRKFKVDAEANLHADPPVLVKPPVSFTPSTPTNLHPANIDPVTPADLDAASPTNLDPVTPANLDPTTPATPKNADPAIPTISANLDPATPTNLDPAFPVSLDPATSSNLDPKTPAKLAAQGHTQSNLKRKCASFKTASAPSVRQHRRQNSDPLTLLT